MKNPTHNYPLHHFRFVNAVVFFGINLNAKNLGGDLYLNFFILCIIELPGAMLCWYLLGRLVIIYLISKYYNILL